MLSAKLKRPELLDPVRRNLNSMFYLLHPNYEVVTEISNRQDRNQRGTMNGYWFPLRYLAMLDQNGQFATIANHFTSAYSSLSTLMEYPELAGPMPAEKPLPSNFRKDMGTLGIVRFRRGGTSATILSDNSTFFTLRKGDAVIQAVRFASAFFGKGQFVGSKTQAVGDEIILPQYLEAPYYQPLDPARKFSASNWEEMRNHRAKSQVCRLTQTVGITEKPDGFQLRIEANGTKGVPVTVEISFREGGQLAGCEQSGPETFLLSANKGSYSVGSDRIRFGPGLSEHRYTQVRGALPRMPGQTVYLTGFTPMKRTIGFEIS